MKLHVLGHSPGAVVAALVLAACAATQDSPPRGPAAVACHTHECKVTVTVTGDCGSAANIVVVPDTLAVPPANQNAVIHWDLETPGFRFADVGTAITFTSPPLPPAGTFHSPVLANQGRKYQLQNRNGAADAGTFKYNVQLLRENGTACQRKDPQIQNG